MREPALKVALIGLGAIGERLVKTLAASGAGIEVLGALVARPEKTRDAACRLFGDLEALLAASPDLVIECAHQQVLKALGPRVLESGIGVVASSVGALADEAVHEALQRAARDGASQLFIPAGALAGVDALAAARQAGLERVRYQRRAPPPTWVKSGAMSAAHAAGLLEPYTVFEGTAREAAKRYPKNANVAATIAIAGIGFERTRVVLVADPSVASNLHSIEAEGEFGRFHTEMSARPISTASTSSKIVAGSLAHAVISRLARITV